MYLKRHYNRPDGWEKQINVKAADGTLLDPKRPEGVCLNPPPLSHVAVLHTGWTKQQNFSGGLVQAALSEKWMTIGKGQITLHVQPEDLVYTIVRVPGRYCCHCKEKLVDDTSGQMARAHVASAHEGDVSPDTQHPAGYVMLNHYECELAQEQHDKWRVKSVEEYKAALQFPSVKGVQHG